MIWAFDKSILNEELSERRGSIAMDRMDQPWMAQHSAIGCSEGGPHGKIVEQTDSEGDMEQSERRSDCELMSSSAESG
jgi:hypothetical protein